MTWLAWRQLRAQAATAAAMTIGVLIALAASRGHVGGVYAPDGSGELTGVYVWLRLTGTALVGVPAAIGAFWGAPMIAGEIEAGTQRLVWTQSITRGRWLLVKLLLTAAVTVVVVGMFTAAVTWWSAPIDATASRISPASFAQRGIVPVGYALFALAAGALLGAITRRTLPAMAAILLTFFTVRLAVQKVLRPHLLHPSIVTADPFGPGPQGGWTLASRTVDASGRTVPTHALESRLVDACHISRAAPDPNAALAACAHQLGMHNLTTAYPASAFWRLQTCELSVFLALTGVAVAGTHWWIQHRIS